MTTYVALLRGVNVGGHRKIPMAALREALTAAGFDRVRTYLQSGNIVLDADDDADTVGEAIGAVIAGGLGASTLDRPGFGKPLGPLQATTRNLRTVRKLRDMAAA